MGVKFCLLILNGSQCTEREWLFPNNQVNVNSLVIELNTESNVHQLANIILQNPQCGVPAITSNQLIISFTDRDIPFDDYGICAESLVIYSVGCTAVHLMLNIIVCC